MKKTLTLLTVFSSVLCSGLIAVSCTNPSNNLNNKDQPKKVTDPEEDFKKFKEFSGKVYKLYYSAW
ncbi:lipoprotein, partial [Mycoplasma putrefaciens]